MQNTKFLAVLSVAAVGLIATLSQAGPDTDEQARLREALRQAMGQPGASAPASAPAKPQPATPPPTPETKPAATPTVVVPIPVEAPAAKGTPQHQPAFPAWTEPEDDANTARLREALRQSLGTQTPAAATVATPATPVISAPVEVAPSVPAPDNRRFADVPAAPADETPAKLEEALRSAMAAQPVVPPAGPDRRVVSTQPSPRLTPAAALIPSPFSAAQQQKLDALLSRYKADQITPQEYHRQRAEIIAAP
ncbi:MAG TPA: hypothetical protein PKN95_05410 [Verrucomicrobiota bacterium]|nr:hypothetical protein [Verrucomicrobiota bacterium]HNT13525.1 hypothetical protein [Verrucomicrobiota bacterium]